MLQRKIRQLVTERLKAFPAVALLGSRQTGKTTLARTFSGTYYDLELEEERLKLDVQWSNLTKRRSLIILDEAQNYPEIFPRIRSAIDSVRGLKGRFLVLGSVSPALMKEVSESLAGRIALCELAPV
jgi:uncharacterized protein